MVAVVGVKAEAVVAVFGGVEIVWLVNCDVRLTVLDASVVIDVLNAISDDLVMSTIMKAYLLKYA
jgi:hypothetical protein